MDKQRLRNYQHISKEIDQLIDQIKSLQERVQSIKATTYNGMPSAHGDNHSIEDTIIKIVDLNAIYRSKIDELTTEQIEIETSIMHLTDPVERKLLRSRYLTGKTWEDVADELGYSLMQTHRIHSAALQHIGEI